MDDVAAFRSVIPQPQQQPVQRRRMDLRLMQVVPALVVAPLLGSAMMAAGIGFLDSFFSANGDGVQWRHIALAFATPSLWSLLCGLAYLQTVTRLREQIGRAECLLLGCASGFLMPLGMDAFDALVMHARLPTWNWGELKAYAIGGLFALPFGFFGGWLFWRMGVRRAPAPLPDFAVVFD